MAGPFRRFRNRMLFQRSGARGRLETAEAFGGGDARQTAQDVGQIPPIRCVDMRETSVAYQFHQFAGEQDADAHGGGNSPACAPGKNPVSQAEYDEAGDPVERDSGQTVAAEPSKEGLCLTNNSDQSGRPVNHYDRALADQRQIIAQRCLSQRRGTKNGECGVENEVLTEVQS